jgi:DNA-binding response OmpR family regulator
MKRFSKTSEQPTPTVSRGTIHVLHPNDEELYFLCDFLGMAGFRSSGSSRADRALDFVTRTRPDILVCPLALPDGSGEEICAQTRRASPHTQVLLTSDRILEPLPDRIRKFSGVEVLRGPFNAVGLLRAVERLIGRDPEGETGE